MKFKLPAVRCYSISFGLVAFTLLFASLIHAQDVADSKAAQFKPATLTRKGTPEPRTTEQVNAILSPNAQSGKKLKPLNIVLAVGKKDHGPETHDYPLFQKRWKVLLAMAEKVNVSTSMGWPSDEQFKSADVIVFYSSNPGWGKQKAKQFEDYFQRGGGAVYIHYGVNGRGAPNKLASMIGLVWSKGSKWRHGPVTLDFVDTKHPISQGYKKITFDDEAYWNLTGDQKSINVLATSVEQGQPRPILWTREHGKGRVFVSILGHNTWTFDDPLFRILALRGIAWTAKAQTDRFNKLVTVGARVK